MPEAVYPARSSAAPYGICAQALGHDREEIVVTSGSADVLRRPGPGPVDASGETWDGIEG